MVEVDEVELDLALSIGGSFGKHTVENPAPDSKPEPLPSDSFTHEVVEPHDKREIQALRRMEAKKKREQKRERVRETEPEWEQVFKKEKTECRNGVSGCGPCRTTEPFRLHPFAPVEYFPLNNVLPLPCWFGSQKKAGGVDGVNGYDKKAAAKSNGSSRCSSSAVSDYQSSSREDGGSTDSHSHSVHSLAEPPHLTTSKERSIGTQPEESASASSHPMNPKQGNNSQERKHIAKESQSKPNPTSPEHMNLNQEPPTSHDALPTMPIHKPLSNENSSPLMETKGEKGKPPKPIPLTTSLSQMPHVSTKGKNGKTVNGFLYRYNKFEVSIVCACHGSTFSPAAFVQHAGGTDITNPLRHITVIPFALG